MKVGFIGLGHMGGPMCRNIIKGGHEVRVHDLSGDAVQTCVSVGGIAAGSVAGAVSGSEVVMTSLPMPSDVEAVALGPDGILANAVAGTIYVDLSTNSPATMKKIAGTGSYADSRGPADMSLAAAKKYKDYGWALNWDSTARFPVRPQTLTMARAALYRALFLTLGVVVNSGMGSGCRLPPTALARAG